MQQINPQSDFPIVRQLEDPADSTTYYVQAVIRNSATGATLDTINLTDQTNQRFTGSWRVVADTSGEGLYVDIETTVYTDSGYTTKSNNYRIVSQEYVVQQRANKGMFGGGGVSFDYTKLRAIVQEEIKKAPKGQRIDFSGVLAAVSDAKRLIRGIKVPDPEKVDLSGVIARLDSFATGMTAMQKDIENVKSEVKESVEASEAQVKEKVEEIDTAVKSIESCVEQTVEKQTESMKENTEERIKEVKDALVEALTKVMPQVLANELIFGNRQTVDSVIKDPEKIRTHLGK